MHAISNDWNYSFLAVGLTAVHIMMHYEFQYCNSELNEIFDVQDFPRLRNVMFH